MGQGVELPSRRKDTPNAVNGKVRPPTRRPNRDSRVREFLIPAEFARLLDAAGAVPGPLPFRPLARDQLARPTTS
jgi:hypothetical protein